MHPFGFPLQLSHEATTVIGNQGLMSIGGCSDPIDNSGLTKVCDIMLL
jgi:hypothetical protein